MGGVPMRRETVADLVELHFAGMSRVGRVFRRSNAAALLRLKDSI
jgi:hypothetical protein